MKRHAAAVVYNQSHNHARACVKSRHTPASHQQERERESVCVYALVVGREPHASRSGLTAWHPGMMATALFH